MAELKRQLCDARPRAHGAFARRLRDRLRRRIAQRHQHALRATVRLACCNFVERLAKCLEPKIRLAFRAIHTIEKRRDVDELRARVHEVEIEDLLAGHG